MTDNGWAEWGHHVLAELKRLNEYYERIEFRLGKIEVELGQLKVKAGIWGACAGLIPGIGAIIFAIVKG